MLTSREIRDEMLNSLLDGNLFPIKMRNIMRDLGFAAGQPGSIAGAMLDVFTEVIFIRLIQQEKLLQEEDH